MKHYPYTCPIDELAKAEPWPEANHNAVEVIGTAGTEVYLYRSAKASAETHDYTYCYVARLNGNLGVVAFDGFRQFDQQVALDKMVRNTAMSEVWDGDKKAIFAIREENGNIAPGTALCCNCMAIETTRRDRQKVAIRNPNVQSMASDFEIIHETIECSMCHYRNEEVCPGCGRPETHKMCPAWGTEYYMSGKLFTKELEEQTREQRQAAIERSRDTEREV